MLVNWKTCIWRFNPARFGSCSAGQCQEALKEPVASHALVCFPRHFLSISLSMQQSRHCQSMIGRVHYPCTRLACCWKFYSRSQLGKWVVQYYFSWYYGVQNLLLYSLRNLTCFVFQLPYLIKWPKSQMRGLSVDIWNQQRLRGIQS